MYMQTIEWPGGHKCASMISVNLNAELFWLRFNPEEVAKMPKTLSMGEYGMTNGLERVLAAFDVAKIKATFFVPGMVAERYPDHIRDIAAKEHEIALMGYGYENMAMLSPAEQREALRKGIRAIESCCGKTPRGFRAPSGELTMDTLRIAHELGMHYSSNLCDDDRPYWKALGSADGTAILEIPVHWPLYDLPYFAFNYNPAFPAGQGRIANYTQVLNNWKDEFSGYHGYGLCYVLQLDPQAIGNPGRIGILEELLGYMNTFGNTWHTTGSEIHAYFKESMPFEA